MERRRHAGRPTREQAKRRQTELLDAAMDIFLERGFEQTTMEGVAAAAGMTKRTVYARYQDKAALFRAMVGQAVQRSAVSRAQLEGLPCATLAETLDAVARIRVNTAMTPEGLRLQRIINTESYRFPDIFALAFEQGAKPVIDFLADRLRRDAAAGQIRVDRPQMAAAMFMSMAVSGPVRIIVSGKPMSGEEIDERIAFAVGLFLQGVIPRRDE